jgi:hypothetical protein
MKAPAKPGLFALLLACAFLWSLPAGALVARPLDKNGNRQSPAANPVYGCTPAGFTLMRSAKGYHLSGVIETPTPGYRFETGVPAADSRGGLSVTLKLTPPPGLVPQVLSTLSVDAFFPLMQSPATQVTVTIDKPYNWGPRTVSCRMAGRAQ